MMSHKGNILFVSIAIAIGMAIGFYSGYLGKEAKQPGEAIRTSDATGHWMAYPNAYTTLNAEVLTKTRIHLVSQALTMSALVNGGKLPQTLETLVAEGLLGTEAIRDGWGRPLVYTVDEEKNTYKVGSLGEDGIPSEDDLP